MALLVGLRPTPQRRKFGSLASPRRHEGAQGPGHKGRLAPPRRTENGACRPKRPNLPRPQRTESARQARDGQGAVQGGVSRRPIPPTASSEGGFLGKATRRETEGDGRGQRRSRRATDGARSVSRPIASLRFGGELFLGRGNKTRVLKIKLAPPFVYVSIMVFSDTSPEGIQGLMKS